MAKRRWTKWPLRVTGGLVALIVLALVAGYAVLQSQAGRDFIADAIGRAASDDTTTVRLDSLDGSLLSVFRIGSVTVGDANGPYAVAEDVQVVWRPLALLGRTVDIASVSVRRVAIQRLPQAAAASDEAAFGGLPGDLSLRVEAVEVTEIDLAAPVLGTAQSLAATAAARLDAGLSGAAIEATLRRTDGGPDWAELALDYAAQPARFTARVLVDEPAGGLVARLAGLPPGERLFVDLAGEGPPDDWQGVWKAETGSDLAAAGAVTVALHGDAIGVSVDGTAQAAALFPADLRPFAEGARFQAAGTVTPTTGIAVERFSAESTALAVSGKGRYGLADRSVSAEVSARVREPGLLSALVSGLTVADAGAEAKLDGTVDSPRLDVMVRTGRVAFDAMQAASVSGSARLTPAATESFALQGTVTANGLDAGGAVPAGLIGDALVTGLTATLGRDGRVSDARISAASGSISAELTGQATPAGTASGEYVVTVDKVAPLVRDTGLALDGRLQAEGTFQADAAALSAHVSANGALDRITGAAPDLAALFGGRIPFSGAAELQDDRVTLIGVSVEPAAGRLDADGTIDLNTTAFSLRYDVALPALKPLSAMAGASLAGRMEVSGTVEGPFAAPETRGQGTVSDLTVQQTPVGSVGFGYAARLDGDDLLAGLRLGGTVRDKNLAGRVEARIADGVVSLPVIDVTLGKNRVSGALDLQAAGTRLSGTVTATLPDLGDLPVADQSELAGSAEIRLTAAVDGGQTLTLAADSEDIRLGGDMALGALTARLAVRDPFGTPNLRGTVEAGAVRVAGIQDGRTKVAFDGDAAALTWSVEASVGGDFPANLASTGRVARTDKATRIGLETLAGAVLQQEIALKAPFAVTWQDGGWQVTQADLAVAGGRVGLSGSLAGGRVDATGAVSDLPLGLVALADPRFQVEGLVAGRFQVSGPADQPILEASLTAHDIRPADNSDEALPGFDLAVDVRQDAGTFSARASLDGPEETRARAAVESAPVLALDPPALTWSSDQALKGELTADGRLALIDTLVGLGEDRLAGRVAARIALAGTLNRPEITGTARLDDGAYEGAATGTILRNMAGELRFTGDSATLVSLTADDGGEGRLTGSGTARFVDADSASGGLTVTFDNFAAVRHTFADIAVSGPMTLEGTVAAPRLAGKLTVIGGEIRVPDRFAADVVELDVVEINAPGGEPKVKPDEPSLAKTLAVALDIAVDVPGRTFVRGRGLDSEWRGNLTVTGTSREPVIGGKLAVVRGTFAFAGKTFVVKQGSVFFPAGSGAVEPELDVVAEAQLTDLVARVMIAGPASRPDITVSSSPELPQEDVLARILFGRSAGELTAIQAAQLAQTAATLSGTGGPGIVDTVRRAIGVDVLDVGSDGGDGRGASLKAGKYLTDDVFLSVTQGTEPGSQKVGVEVQVTPNITIESDVSGAADGNVGVNWKWDY